MSDIEPKYYADGEDAYSMRRDLGEFKEDGGENTDVNNVEQNTTTAKGKGHHHHDGHCC